MVSEMFHLRKVRSADTQMWFHTFLVLVWTLVKMSLPSFWLWLNLCVLEIHLCIRFKMLSTQKIKIFYGKTTIERLPYGTYFCNNSSVKWSNSRNFTQKSTKWANTVLVILYDSYKKESSAHPILLKWFRTDVGWQHCACSVRCLSVRILSVWNSSAVYILSG